MPQNSSSIGRCPRCDTAIPRAYVLIEYETKSGEQAIYAECPDCADVVAPE